MGKLQVLTLLVACSLVGLAVVLAQRGRDPMSLEAHATDGPRATTPVQPSEAGEVIAAAREPAPVVVAETTAAPDEQVMSADAAPLPTFEARLDLPPPLAGEVAEEMFAAAERHWRIYQIEKRAAADGQLTTKMDYLFAVWPDLPTLIASEQVSVRISPVEPPRPVAGGHVFYSFDVSTSTLKATFHMQHWHVSLGLPRLERFAGLYDALAATSEAAIRKASGR